MMGHIENLIKQYGSSFYFYDLDGFESQLKNIKSILHPDIKIWYATKANPLSKILEIFHKNDFGVDIASLGELSQAQKAGVKNIIATGPAKSLQYLKALIDAKVSLIVIESIQQLEDLNAICDERGIKMDVLLRLQLDWEGSLKSVLGGSGITPFGLHPSDWEKVDLAEYPHLSIKGLHCFQWGNILDLDQLRGIWNETISRAVEFSKKMKIHLEILDLGGGLGISYSTDHELDFKNVHELLLEFKDKYGLQRIWLELGRYSIAKFGHYLTPIIDIKSVRGKKLIITEGGINHLARPALVSESFPVSALRDGTESQYSIHGPLCTALDYLGDHNLPADLRSGEWLHFKKTGAYGFTESMPYFLCHTLSGEAYLHDGEIHHSRKPEAPSLWMK